MISDTYLTQVKAAWQQMTTAGTFLEGGRVRNFIISSWKRCRQLGVNPYIQELTNNIFVADISRLLQSHDALIKTSRPFMLSLHQLVSGSGFLVALADRDGTILELLGDDEIVKFAKNSNIGVGANFSEKNIGTNTLGTVVIEKKPIQVVAEEHYCKIFHEWTCSAAPIFTSSGEMIGILNMSGSSEHVHSHTLGMVVAAAKAIENEMRLHETYQELRTSYQYSQTIINSMSEGLLSVNSSGEVTQINAVAREILDLKEDERINPDDPCLRLIQDALQWGHKVRNKEVVNKKINCRYLLTVVPIFRDSGLVTGAVAILRESSKVHRFVTNIVGAKASFTFDDLIGQSVQFKRAITLAKQVSQSDSIVLLQGESGTGKDLFAQAIHNNSSRETGPYVAVNCAAIPRELVGSELFGYEDGAFTGAKKGGRPGKFELANGGTIFLDEIGDMSLDLQVNFLRVLEEKRIHRLGGHGSIPINVRVIAATNKNLLDLVQKGDFREDLYFRLGVLLITLPPLRERKEDIIHLTNYFITKLNWQLHKNVTGISTEIETAFKRYSWPGNIRELQNFLERAMHYANGDILTLHHFPELFGQNIACGEHSPETIKTLKEVEQEVILKTLKRFDNNISRTADALGITRNTLYKKMRELVNF